MTLSQAQSAAGDRVVDGKGKPVPSQRLANGELVFLAHQSAAPRGQTLPVEAGAGPAARRRESRRPPRWRTREFTVKIDEHTGGITSLFSRSLNRELVDAKAATALNDYFYLPGSDLKGLQRNGPPRISVKESGPLVASLLIESDAPGCKRLLREVRVVDGLDYVEIINTVDKLPVRAKEGVHFGFGFNVPDGTRAHGCRLGRRAARAGPDPGLVQELVQRAAVGGHLQRPLRRHLVAGGRARSSRSAASPPT